jgi:DNA polymerase-1
MKFVSNQINIYDDIERATVQECIDYFEDKQYIALDTETEGYDPHSCDVLSLQLGDTNEQFVIDCSTIDIRVFKDLLESGKTIIMQNAQFDLRFLLHKGIDVKMIYDTLLAECVLFTGYSEEDGRKLGLDALVHKYCGAKLDKSIRGNIHREGLSKRVIIYAAEDVHYLHIIREKQLKEIEKYKLQHVLDLENKVVRVFAKMNYTGITLDQEIYNDIVNKVKENLDNNIKELDQIVMEEEKLSSFTKKHKQLFMFGVTERDVEVNWSSSAQKLKILNALGIKADSTKEAVLIKNRNKHKIVLKLLQYNKNAKLADAFGENILKMVNKKTGRIHASIWQVLSTGRISMSYPKKLGVIQVIV